MCFSSSHIKILTVLLLVVQLCLPLSGSVYVFEVSSQRGENHTGVVCTQADVAADRESHHGHEQIPHCHELDAPCESVAGFILDHSPVIAALKAADKGVLLPGYYVPIDIPPEIRV